jgi:hypothetical protein
MQGLKWNRRSDFTAAIQACKSGDFDLVVMGHSIPYEDKQAIAKQLREICAMLILSLLRPYETSLPLAEYKIESGRLRSFWST